VRVLVILAATNAIFITWATVLDARHASALARALGTTPGQLTTGLSAAQLLPAIPGAVIGIPAGIGLYAAISNGAGLTIPPTAWIATATLGTLLAIAALTAIPARLGARRPIAGILQAETALGRHRGLRPPATTVSSPGPGFGVFRVRGRILRCVLVTRGPYACGP
jgi:hypothetical protein